MPKLKETAGSSVGTPTTSNASGNITVTAASPSTPRAQNFTGPTGPVSSAQPQSHPARAGHPGPNAPALRGRWANPGNTSLLRNTLTQNARSITPSQVGANANSLTAGMNNVSLNPAASVWNPSIGPTPSQANMMSMAAWKARVAPTRVGTHVTTRAPCYNQVCRATNNHRWMFRKGDIIAIPFHTANTNPNVDPTRDDQWQMTVWGPVYSKRRMVVVLWVYQRDMFCLPMYTFEHTGLRQKHRNILHEYVAVKNAGKPHVPQGQYPAIEVVSYRKDMDPDSSIVLTGGVRVGCNEDITWSGRVTKKSYLELVALYQRVVDQAQAEPWVDDKAPKKK